MIATVSGTLLVSIALAASILTIVAAFAVWSVFHGTRSQTLSQSQSTALDALQSELTAYVAKSDRLESENVRNLALIDQQDKRLTAQQDQINHLREMVTQTAKVDDLIYKVEAGFVGLGVSKDLLIVPHRHKRNGD